MVTQHIPKNAQWLKIDETKALHRNQIFWIAICTPMIISILFSIPLWKGLNFELSYTGYKFFLSHFSFPIWLLSGSLIFGVMVGRFHGSAQRATLITQAQSQNNFSNYLIHREHFQKYITPLAEEYDLKVDAFKIYGIVFSNSTPIRLNINLVSGIYRHYETQLNYHFWSKMKFAAKTNSFNKQEVNIYFPRFAKSIGINAEACEFKTFEEIKSIMTRIRSLYRRAMEYGMTRSDSDELMENEESGIAEVNGSFNKWSVENGFNRKWSATI